MGEQKTRTLVHNVASCRMHPAATYISPEDEAALAAGKPTSWQSSKGSIGINSEIPHLKTKKSQENSALDARLLAELPPHYNPRNQ